MKKKYLVLGVVMMAVLVVVAVFLRGGTSRLDEKAVGPGGNGPADAAAVTLRLVSDDQVVSVGDKIRITIELDTTGELVDAFDAEVTFDPEVFSAEDVQAGELLARYPIAKASEGSVRFVGMANAGPSGPEAFTGTGVVGSFVLTARHESAETVLEFSDKTVLASRGKNILGEAVSSRLSVRP